MTLVRVSFHLLQEPVGDAAHTVTISRSHTGEGGNVVQKYFEGHEALLAGGAGYKSLLVLDGKAEAYIHVTAIKVRVTESSKLKCTVFCVWVCGLLADSNVIS